MKTFLFYFSNFSDIRLKEQGMRMEKVRISGMFGQAAWDLVLQIADFQSRGPEYCLKVVPIE